MACCYREFRVPSFNLVCNVWYQNYEHVGAPDLVVECQLKYPNHSNFVQPSAIIVADPLWPMYILVPAGTDIPDPNDARFIHAVIECPAGSARFYFVSDVDDAHKGFPNEHRIATVYKLAPWPVPAP